MFKRPLLVSTLVLIVGLLAACAPQPVPDEPISALTEMEPAAPTAIEAMPILPTQEGNTSMEMGMGELPAAPIIPAGLAYADGQEIRFIHTEVSDPDVAGLLSDMMSSPVIHVPSLTDAPESMLAKVYVFKNGIEGMGPLGFQPDVFDNPPGAEGYSPLRRIVFATWADGSDPRELKSLADVLDAESNGELTIEESNIVVNMPFVTWPGGER